MAPGRQRLSACAQNPPTKEQWRTRHYFDATRAPPGSGPLRFCAAVQAFGLLHVSMDFRCYLNGSAAA